MTALIQKTALEHEVDDQNEAGSARRVPMSAATQPFDSKPTSRNVGDVEIKNRPRHRVIAEHDGVIAEHDELIPNHEWMIARHEIMPAEHDFMIAEHEFMIAKHEFMIARLEFMIA